MALDVAKDDFLWFSGFLRELLFTIESVVTGCVSDVSDRNRLSFGLSDPLFWSKEDKLLYHMTRLEIHYWLKQIVLEFHSRSLKSESVHADMERWKGHGKRERMLFLF